MATDNVDLPDLSHEAAPAAAALLNTDAPAESAPKHSAQDLEAVFDVPVTVFSSWARAPSSSSTARSAKPSTSTSMTAWSRAAKSCWSRTGWASP
jgi:hypothetical protein